MLTVKTLKRTFFLQFLLVLILLAGGYWASQAMLSLNKPAVKQTRERTPPAVRVVVAERSNPVIKIKSQGVVAPVSRIQLTPEVSGKVIEVAPAFLEGNLVRAGDWLLQLNPIDYELALARAKASLLSAQLDFEDKQARYPATSLAVKQSREQLEAARKQVEKAAQDLDNTSIKAPFPALVKDKAIDLGQLASPGMATAWLLRSDSAEIPLTIRGSELNLLSEQPFTSTPGNRVRLKLSLGAETVWRDAALQRIEASVNESSRTYTAIARLDDPYALLDPDLDPMAFGSFVSAFIDSRPLQNIFEIPVAALQADHSIYLVDAENRLIKRHVRLIYKNSQSLFIDDGLIDGDQVVLSPLGEMYEGLEVSVVTAE